MTEMLLCEYCGYSLAGLDADGTCPECATPIADSLADPRIGSVWQRSGGVLRGAIEAARRPRRMMRRVQLDGRRDWVLIAASVLISTAVPAFMLGVAAPRLMMGVRIRRLAPLSEAEWLVQSLQAWGVLASLVAVGIVGSAWTLRLGGLLRPSGRRDLSRAICAHASLGFVCGAAAGWVWIGAIAVQRRVSRGGTAWKAVDSATAAALIGLGVGACWFVWLMGVGIAVNARRARSDSANLRS